MLKKIHLSLAGYVVFTSGIAMDSIKRPCAAAPSQPVALKRSTDSLTSLRKSDEAICIAPHSTTSPGMKRVISGNDLNAFDVFAKLQQVFGQNNQIELGSSLEVKANQDLVDKCMKSIEILPVVLQAISSANNLLALKQFNAAQSKVLIPDDLKQKLLVSAAASGSSDIASYLVKNMNTQLGLSALTSIIESIILPNNTRGLKILKAANSPLAQDLMKIIMFIAREFGRSEITALLVDWNKPVRRNMQEKNFCFDNNPTLLPICMEDLRSYYIAAVRSHL